MLGGLCLLAILVVGGIVLAVVLVNDGAPKADKFVDNRDPLTLIDVLTGKLQPRRFNGTWIDETSYHYFDHHVRLSIRHDLYHFNYLLITYSKTL